jgi:hypothetical protein
MSKLLPSAAVPTPHEKYWSEKAVRLAQKMQVAKLAQKVQVGPCIPVGMQLEKAEVGPTSGQTWRLSHLDPRAGASELAGGLELAGALELAGEKLVRELLPADSQL